MKFSLNFILGSTTSSNETYVFDLKNELKYPIKAGGKNAICSSNQYGPCFGNKDLWIDYESKYNRYSRRYETKSKFKSTTSSVFKGSPFISRNTETYVMEVFYRQ